MNQLPEDSHTLSDFVKWSTSKALRKPNHLRKGPWNGTLTRAMLVYAALDVLSAVTVWRCAVDKGLTFVPQKIQSTQVSPPHKRKRTSQQQRGVRNKKDKLKFDNDEIVEVDFNGTWWKDKILFYNRLKYTIQYYDEEENVERNVPVSRMRKTKV